MQWLIIKLSSQILTRWITTSATISYAGTEKTDGWRTVVRYTYVVQNKTYEGVKLFTAAQNIHSQMDARLLADKLVRQYPIGSEHNIQVHKQKAWLSKLP